MKRFGWPFALIAVTTLIGILGLWPPKEKLKLGIDLSGGTILVYQTSKEGARADYKLDDLVTSLKRRINPDGLLDIQIRKVGADRIEIIVPEAAPEEIALLKRKMTDVGSLEFRILANEKHDGPAIQRALQPGGLKRPPTGYRWARLAEIYKGQNPQYTATSITDPSQSWIRNRFADKTMIILEGKDATGAQVRSSFRIKGNTGTTIELAKPHGLSSITAYEIEYNPSEIQGGPKAITRDEPRGGGITDRYILVKLDRYNATGDLLQSVSKTMDEKAQPAVSFLFKSQGARRFGSLTREHAPEEGGAFRYNLAILLDNMVISAPELRSEIREQGIIENMPAGEVDYLIEILRTGSLPASINPVPLQEEKIGPTLGKDTIEKGLRAITISMFVVPIFMIVYYRFAGVVAVIALVLNMILLVGSMGITSSSFTLPGLAGLALTIGMAVDANVLIFERMREEAEKGASLAMQIRNGFSRAWTTIFDSNITTVLSGLVLWAIGTEEIKGFATTLIIGLVWNLFTAVYVSRVIFEFCYQKGWIKKLHFMKFLGKTQVDFISPRRYFQIASVLVIGIGLAWFIKQGSANYNIDFTGGTLVTLQLDPSKPELKDKSEGQRTVFVRNRAEEALKASVAVETLNVGQEARGTRFNVRTTIDKADEVQQKIKDAFQDVLAKLQMTWSAPTAIPAAPAGGEAGASPDRFAGGRRFELMFNRPVESASIATEFVTVLGKAGLTNPEIWFEIKDPPRAADETEAKENKLILRTNLEEKDATAYLEQVAAAVKEDPNFLFERVANFGGAVAADARNLAAIAIVASWVIMIVYLWFRFKSVLYGLAAVVALMHDVLITLGAVALSPYKIDLPMVAAFLTLIGFSVNDTIVIFDRIRELKGKSPHLTGELINTAVNQTLSRTILTALTAFTVVVIMWLFGGEGLAPFSFALVIGFLSGTYSTIFIAAPILLDWAKKPKGGTAKSSKELAGAAGGATGKS
jgi:SecD/SecF fusion protein